MRKLAFAACLALAAGAAPADIDGFDAEGIPFVRKGFGVRRNFYQSGRISAKVADVAGLFELNYVGRQPCHRQNVFRSAAENCAWTHQFMPFVQIDGKPYRLAFENTAHYPFGYRSECTLDGVRLRHELVLDGNALFRRITVLENKAKRQVTASVAQMDAGLAKGVKWRLDEAAGRLRAELGEKDWSVAMEVGSSAPVRFPPSAASWGFRFDMVAAKPAASHLFWWVFDRRADEDLSPARVDRAFADFDARHAKDARFETGDGLVDGWLGYVAPMSAAYEVDGRGAFRASPTYWVWGWDAMVHAGALALSGRAGEVKRMLAFHRDVADEKLGILHSYDTGFGVGSAVGGGTMPPSVQLYWVILLNDYVNATGDAAFRDECLAFARRLVERAKASVDPSDGLPHARGYYPDHPEAVGQREDDVALINCAVYWQGLCAWRELSGEGAADCDRTGKAIVEALWDAKAGYWADSRDVRSGVRRAHRPLYGLFHVSPFARDLRPAPAADLAAYMEKAFFMNDRLAMFGYATPSFCADGNQLGSYYPVVDRTYWNAQNAAGRVGAIADFRRIVAAHARVLTYPEGQTADVLNGDAADYSDELGNKQFFAAKGWLSDALDLWLGLDLRKDRLRFRPMNDGRPFAVRGLSLRGATLDVEMSGYGTNATYVLNGRRLAGGDVPWSALGPGANRLAIRLAPVTVFEAAGPVTDKTPGFRFGNVTFTDNDRVCARFEPLAFDDRTPGRLTTKRLRLPHKEPGRGAYFKLSFDARYAFTSGKGGAPQRCNQGVFFYDRNGRVLPDCYDTMYPGETMRRYERVLYAWDEVDSVEVFFQKPWGMRASDGDSCTLDVANVKVETATWEDAAAYCDATYAQLPPLGFSPEGDRTALLPRTMEALRTGRPWRVVMLGDSIVQDTFHSQFHALVRRAFPRANAEWILSMRGGTGCWHYILAENFYPYVADHKPDLLVIGGISNGRRHDETPAGRDVGPTGPDAMVRVAKLARERLGCEVLVVNSPLAVDFRQYDEDAPSAPLPKTGFSVRQHEMVRNQGWDYERLRQLCADAKIPWWDAFRPCYAWLFGSGLPFRHYSRDAVHSGELGKQIIGRVMLEYFTSGTRPPGSGTGE